MTQIIAPPWELPAEPITELPTRKKTEVYWSGLVGTTLAIGAPINLVTLLKGLPAPQVGTLAPFFNTTSDKLNVFNDNSSVTFKLNLVGTWSGGSGNRSMQLDFTGTNGNRLVASRDAAVTSDVITLATFFSVDTDGNLAQNGAAPVITPNGGTYTATAILLIAEQVTKLTSISAV